MSLRILHSIHSLVGGGAERQLGLLASELAKRDIDVAISCVNAKSFRQHPPNVAIYECPFKDKGDLRIFKHIDRAIRDFQPDLVHTWLPASTTIPTLIVSARHRRPCIVAYRNRMRFRRPLSVVEFFCAVGFAHGVISNNPVRDSSLAYRWLFARKQGKEIENAVCTGDHAKDARSFSATERPRRILFVGRITVQKNWSTLIRAVQVLDVDFPWRLDIHGEGEDRPRLVDMIQDAGLGNRVRVCGFTSEIYRTMAESDVLVLPSWNEGSPNVVLEAMSIGLPCICSDIPAHQRFFGGEPAALSFDPRNPEALAAALRRVFSSNQQAESLSNRGRSLTRALTPASTAEKHVEYYRHVLDRVGETRRHGSKSA